MKKWILKHKWSFVLLLAIALLSSVDVNLSKSALNITWNNIVTMMGVIPPIFILIGLMDVWVPKETMIKYMGSDSGALGVFLAFLLGAMAAGPLYAAFPVAGLLLKKGARLANVVFFLGTWTSAKIPLLIFEMTSLGVGFTIIHVATMLTLYLIGSFAIEKLMKPHEIESIAARAAQVNAA